MIKYLLAISLLGSVVCQAQEFDPVKEAFKTGNAAQLKPHLDETVELSILGKESEASNAEAEKKLRTFFDEHPPRSFSILHSGVSKSDVRYMIGSLVSAGSTFRVSVYLSKRGDKYVIQSLEIEAN